MTNRKELPFGHGSSFISFAEENLRNFNRNQKQERRDNKKLTLGKDDHQEEWPKVNPQAFYLVRCYYPNGEDKIIQGNNFAERVKPVNVKKLSHSQFGKRLEKLTI